MRSTAERQFMDAFSQALAQHREVRVRWLAYLRSQLKASGPPVAVPVSDIPRLDALERQLPDDPRTRFNALVSQLELDAPALFTENVWTWMHVERQLMDLTERFQRSMFLNPLQPRHSGGRPQGSDKSIAELGALLTHKLDELCKKGSPCTAQNLIAKLGWSDPKTLNRAVRRLGFKDFPAFKEKMLPRFPALFLSCSLVILHPRTSSSERSVPDGGAQGSS
jgi:hypothetical protein